MKVDNRLTQEFLLRYPTEAARVLEQVSADHVAALLGVLPMPTGAPVMAAMLPEKAVACLGAMASSSAAKLLAELPVSAAARIYQRLAPAKQDEVSGQLADKTRRSISRYLEYPPGTAGALLISEVDMLPENITVAEAIRRIERFNHSVSCEIYIIDDAHHLTGMIDIGSLLTASRNVQLRDIMERKTQAISAHSAAETLLSHPGWQARRRLPVVERDNTLLGVLHFKHLRDSVGETNILESRDPLENLLSLAGLYWLSVAQLLDSMLSIVGPGKGGRR